MQYVKVNYLFFKSIVALCITCGSKVKPLAAASDEMLIVLFHSQN